MEFFFVFDLKMENIDFGSLILEKNGYFHGVGQEIRNVLCK